MDDNLNDLAAALNGHQVTDEQGQVTEEQDTSDENPAVSDEKTTETELDTAEKSAETEDEVTKASSEETENESDEDSELAEDDSGKRYVPENRFKKVYGELKSKERELESLRRNNSPQNEPSSQTDNRTRTPGTVNKTDALEVELLFQTLPQFNPSSENYSKTLDEMGYEILNSNPGITRLEAARRAMARAKDLSKAEIKERVEARSVKSQQSDQGITNRVVSRQSTQVDPSRMSLEEKEAWLKQNGQW